MIRRQTWIILGLFLLLLASTLFWQQTKLKKASEETPVIATQEKEETLFDPSSAPISYLMLQRVEDGTTIEFQKQSGQWTMLKPKAEAEITTIESAVSSLFSATIIAKPSEATDLAVLGLQPPVYRMLVSLESGKKITINIGKSAGTGTGYYVLTDTRVVYLVNKYSLDALIRLLDVPPIMPSPTPTSTPEPTLEATDVLTATQEITPTP